MTLVEYDASVKVFATPLQELFEPGLVLGVLGSPLRLPDQGGVGGVHDSLLDVVVDLGVDLGVLHLGEEVDVNALSPDVLQVPLGVVLEVVGDRNPDGAFPTLQVILENDSGNGTTFAHTRAVADQESGPGFYFKGLTTYSFSMEGGDIIPYTKFLEFV